VTVPSGASGTQVTRREYDRAARLTRLIENYLAGQSGPDKNKTTELEYTADGNLKKLRAKSTTPGDQVTEWIYGTTLSDSDLASNALVRQKIYPDSTGSSDRVYLKWNRQSEPREFRDQAAGVHTLQYDKLGRLEHDRVTTLAGGIDGTVRRLTAAYGVHGLTKLASWNNATVGSGSVVNEVELVYNNFGQIVQDRQAHDGVAGSGSPRVEYEYENGSANHVRLKKMVYPTSTSFVEPLYGDALGQDDVLSRVKELRFTKSGTPVTAAEYTYLGMDRPVVVDYLEPKVRLNTASGSGNYPYAGLDRFDRFLQALWQYYGSPSGDREKVVYGYDRSGNRLTRDNQLSGSGGQDEKYGYDGLWQVGTLDRGTLSGGNIGSKVFGQGWTYDQTGNWANFKQDNNGNGTWDLNQNRGHNTANEITSIQVWGAVAHDALGNMTRIPKPSALGSRYACVWDAWNRLVEVKETDGSGNPTSTVATYRYDGFWRRIRKVVGASTRDYYYSLGWQVLEERVGGSLDRQFVWGIRHIDDLVLRDRGSERLYAVHDAMHVTAVVNASGAVQERYGYDGFGRPRVMTAAFAPQDPSTRDWETLFDGYRFDRETGLYQVRLRYLHAELGRWMSRDPLGELGGFNLYTFCGNSPLTYIDSDGRIVWMPILIPILYGAGIGFTFGTGIQVWKHGWNWRNYDLYDIGASTLTGAIGWGALMNISKVGRALFEIPGIRKSLLSFPTQYMKDKAIMDALLEILRSGFRIAGGGLIGLSGCFVDYPVEDALDDLSRWRAGSWRAHLD
jgi:RHS repeat-associated protein